MKERRIYKRHIAILPAKIETVSASGEKKVFEVETRNISIGGAFVHSENLSFFEKGKRVLMDFTVPKGRFFSHLVEIKNLIDGQGRMVRAGSDGIGVHFEEEF